MPTPAALPTPTGAASKLATDPILKHLPLAITPNSELPTPNTPRAMDAMGVFDSARKEQRCCWAVGGVGWIRAGGL